MAVIVLLLLLLLFTIALSLLLLLLLSSECLGTASALPPASVASCIPSCPSIAAAETVVSLIGVHPHGASRAAPHTDVCLGSRRRPRSQQLPTAALPVAPLVDLNVSIQTLPLAPLPVRHPFIERSGVFFGSGVGLQIGYGRGVFDDIDRAADGRVGGAGEERLEEEDCGEEF